MTEKRSDYRKKVKQQKNKKVLHKIKSAFNDEAELDVNADFKRDPVTDQTTQQKRTSQEKQTPPATTSKKEGVADKGLRLKRRLNQAILIVLVLIVLVLLALFHL
ncbi:hypothetical protein [Lactobacillus sp. ESL0681]|uniref:hypothetical protein n=1 Tax=Lactobacillus sp. ESL0681 TaxID=2983211 RepID=UPI0023F6FEAB|nr:hypothetical protein [Lactobacillus sp. ESL0681]WEV40594.1 hypothetical protein OZX59_01395 [Lactobacillus sp. ESL0681]